ncbi:hypothetical protein VE03_10216 [Pseudogymnoascus sp. 23342-1-I1]|nr:hypothetical protein VE03_10216 [Pseudogymnoascus sp. 23342-1-I1]
MSWRIPVTVLAQITSTISWLYMSYSDKASIEQDVESGQRTSSTIEEVDHERPKEQTHEPQTPICIIGAETSSNPPEITRAGRDIPDFGILQLDTYDSERADSRRDVISGGSTGLIYLLPSRYVRKTAYPDSTRKQSLRDIEHEYKIYQRLPRHDLLLEMVGYSMEHGLILEYMPNGNLREYLQTKAADVSLDQRLQWACDAAEALHLVHSHNIIHCDVKPENFLLDSRLRLRIIDFSGSSIDGSYFSAVESARFCLPRPWEAPSSIVTDVFALGSTIYEIMTGTQPYAHCTDEEVEALFREGTFPPVDRIPCGEVIKRCWHSEVHSAEEIRLSIKAEVQKLKDT